MGAVRVNQYDEVPPSLRFRELAIVEGSLYRGDADEEPQEITAAAITRAVLIEKLGFEPADDSALAEVARSGQYEDLQGVPDLSVFDEIAGYASERQFPPNGDENVRLFIARDTGLVYRYDGSEYIEVSGKAPIWGDVGGDLTDQADLAQALAAKLEEIPSEYLTQTEGDDRYLQDLPAHDHTATDVQHGTRTVAAALDAKLEEIPSEYLTETEGDDRYLRSLPGHGHAAQDIGYADGTVASALASLFSDKADKDDVRTDADIRAVGDGRYLQSLPDHSHTAQSVEYGASSVAQALQDLASGKADTGDVRTDEQIRDVVAALVAGGDNVSVSYDDANDRLEINSTASSTGGGLTEENVRDIVAGALAGTDGVTVNNDDSGNTLTIGFDVSLSDLDTRLDNIETTLGQKANSSDTRNDEGIRTVVASFLQGGANIDVSHDDGANALTISFTGEAGGGLDAEGVRDTVAQYIVSDGRINVTTKNSGQNFEISVSDPRISDVQGLEDALDGKADASDVPSTEDVRDTVAAFVEGGASIGVTHDDSNDTLTIAFTGEAGGGLDAQGVRDTVQSYIMGEGRVNVGTKNSGANMKITVDDPSISQVQGLEDALDGKADASIVRNDRDIRNVVGAQVAGGNNVSVDWQDNDTTLTINASGGVTEERARDVISNMVRGRGGITVDYDDGSDTLTLGYVAPSAGIDVDAIMADAPTGLYMLDEGGGTTAADTSGNGRDGTYEGAVEHGAAPVAAGTAASLGLPGAADNAPRVLLGTGSDLGGGDEGNTIEAWFNADDVQRSQVIAEAGATSNGLSLQIRDGQLHAVTSESSNTISVPIEAGIDYHAVGVWKSGDYITLYLQGVQEESVSPGSSNTLDAGSDDAGIGAVAGGMVQPDGTDAGDATLGFGGRLGPVAFYDKPLSAERIAAHAKTGGGLDAQGVRDTMESFLVGEGRVNVTTKNSGANLKVEVADPSISNVTGLQSALNGLSQSQQDHENDTDNPHDVEAKDIVWHDQTTQGRGGKLSRVLVTLFDNKIEMSDLYRNPVTVIPCVATPGPQNGQVTIEWNHPDGWLAHRFVVLGRYTIIDPERPLYRPNILAEINFQTGRETYSYTHTPPSVFNQDVWKYQVVAVGGPHSYATPQ